MFKTPLVDFLHTLVCNGEGDKSLVPYDVNQVSIHYNTFS